MEWGNISNTNRKRDAMNRNNLLFILIFIVVLTVFSAKCDTLEILGARLQLYRQVLHSEYPRAGEIIADWDDTGLAQVSGFSSVREVVTNDWENVIGNMESVTSNRSERLILLAAGIAATPQEYTNRIDTLAGCVISNKVTLVEMRFYMTNCAKTNRQTADCLISDCEESAVSNLIMKLNRAGVYPEGVSHIFSGEAKRLREAYDRAHQ